MRCVCGKQMKLYSEYTNDLNDEFKEYDCLDCGRFIAVKNGCIIR